MKTTKLLTIAILIVGAFALSLQAAEVPNMITVQGFLASPDGQAVPNAEYSAVFTIYDVASGGSPLWTESRMIGTVDGVFTLMIGSDTPLPADMFSNANLFLGIAIDGDPELSPRQRLVTSPYAFRALYADTAAFAQAGAGGGGAAGWADDGNAVRLDNASDSVGIGVSQPSYKLEISGQAISGTNNLASGVGSTISGGGNNTASGERSVVCGGQAGIASGNLSAIGGGYNNIAEAEQAVVAGGQNNVAHGAQSAISGGEANVAQGWRSAVGGGYIDSASGDNSVVAGGIYNTAAAHYSTIGGGATNYANGEYSTVGGGTGNVAPAFMSTVAGGGYNEASGQYAAIPGGLYNVASGQYAMAAGVRAQATNDGCFVWSDPSDMASPLSSTTDNEFAVRATGGFRFETGTGPTTGAQLAAGSGSWSSMSDRNTKENFDNVDCEKVLDKVVSLPISTWNYKTQDEAIRHIGPVAQDFYAAFGVGEDEKHITAIDADGVALAAIKALYAKQRRIDSQSQEIAQMKQELARLQKLVQQLLDKND